jgi:hypothetical protein
LSRQIKLYFYEQKTSKTHYYAFTRKEAMTLSDNSNARTHGGTKKEVQEMTAFLDARGTTVFYSINYKDNQGFLVLSADRRLAPVLAYSDEGSFDLKTSNPGIQLWKDLVISNLNEVEKNDSAHIDVVNHWKQFEEGNFANGRTSDAPVLTPEASCEYFVTHPTRPTGLWHWLPNLEHSR